MTRPPADGLAWPERLALAFVALALVLVLVAPMLTARRTSELRNRIDDVAEPARDAITRVQYELAREMSSLRGYLLTGDTTFLARFRERTAHQERALEELSRLAAELGPEAVAATATLRDRILRWHERADPGRPGILQREMPDGDLPLDQRLYEQSLTQAAALDQLVGALARELRERIRREERRGVILTIVLTGMALLATGTLLWFGRRLRALAVEADRQRGEAEAALAATRRAFEARDRLVRGVTHDVKNPLGAADGYAELLELGLKGQLTGPQAETVRAIRRSLRSALLIIDDLLELARAERGHLPIALQEVRLNDLVDRIADAHRGAVEAAGQTLQVSAPAAPLVARTDPRRVEQVLANLLSNAAKYAGRGARVTVELAWESGAAGGNADRALITVRDTGPGIPEEDLERVFSEFHRLNPHDFRGHGLGLAIGRHVARQLGGDLTVLSAPGEGAAFTLRLPLERAPAPDPVEAEA